MDRKPTYEMLEQQIQALKKEIAENESNKEFVWLFKHAPNGVFVFDNKGIIVDVNISACTILKRQEQDLVGSELISIVCHEDKTVFQALLSHQTKIPSGSFLVEQGLLRGDGTILPVEASVKSPEKSDRRFLVFKDLSLQKQTETALKESEKKYRTLFEKAGDSIFFLKVSGEDRGKILDTNLAAAEMHGYSLDEMFSLNIRDLDAEDAVEKIPERIRKMMDGEWIKEEIIHRRKDGSEFPVEISAGIIELGEEKYILAFDRDITERKASELKLRKSRNTLQEQLLFFQTLIDTIPGPIFYKDEKGLYLGCNKAFEVFAGLKKESLVGKTVYDIAPRKIADIYHQADSSLLKSGGVQIYESRVKGSTGKFHDVIFNKAVFHKQDGSVGGLVGVMVDITENRIAEQEKKIMEAQLYQTQKMEAIGMLAGGIAHDFNNILSGILGYTQLAIRGIEPDSKVHAYLEKVFTAGQRASDLIRQIQAFSSQQEEERSQPVKLRLIIEEALKLIRASLPSSIEIQEHLDSEAQSMGNATQIHQVVMNLCTNAGHAMGQAGGVLTVSLKDITMDVKEASIYPDLEPGSYAQLTVGDTGHGIQPDILDRIFDPFFTTKDKNTGTGMGLSVVHRIVRNHHGTVIVDSKPGQGAIFRVLLPVFDGNPLQMSESVEETFSRGNERILLVDDEDIQLEIGREFLKSSGYKVVVTASSVDAFSLVQKNPNHFDLVISDFIMPIMTGDVLARQIRSQGSDIPIILCTGYSDSELLSKDKLDEAGISALILKPIIQKDLLKTVRKVLDDQETSSLGKNPIKPVS